MELAILVTDVDPGGEADIAQWARACRFPGQSGQGQRGVGLGVHIAGGLRVVRKVALLVSRLGQIHEHEVAAQAEAVGMLKGEDVLADAVGIEGLAETRAV